MSTKANFFQIVTVSDSSFPVEPQCSMLFHSINMSFTNRGSGVVQYSFDGTNVHGDLDTSDPGQGFLSFEGRAQSKIWFRLASGGSSDVRVEAWR